MSLCCLTVCYNVTMNKTLTIRLDKTQDGALTRRAEALGKTRSALVRELIEKGLEAQPLGHRIGHLKGILDLPEPKDGLRRRIKDRNWR
jgi:ribbon-helix-helix CopG family protein